MITDWMGWHNNDNNILQFHTKVKFHCVVPENIHAHPKEGQCKFQGGGSFKSHFFEQKYDTKMEFLGGGGFNLK